MASSGLKLVINQIKFLFSEKYTTEIRFINYLDMRIRKNAELLLLK